MSSKTHPIAKTPKVAPVPPGTKKGPMQLPVSYNIRDYRVDHANTPVKRRRSPSEYRLVKGGTAKRSTGGATRYRSNKLLEAGPIE